MSVIGMTLVTKCIASNSERRLEGTAILAIYIAAKDILSRPPLVTRWSALVFKSGCVVWVTKHLKGDWFMVLH